MDTYFSPLHSHMILRNIFKKEIHFDGKNYDELEEIVDNPYTSHQILKKLAKYLLHTREPYGSLRNPPS